MTRSGAFSLTLRDQAFDRCDEVEKRWSLVGSVPHENRFNARVTVVGVLPALPKEPVELVVRNSDKHNTRIFADRGLEWTVSVNNCSCTRNNIDPEVREHVAAIRDAGRRAASLTSQLLTFSRHQFVDPVDLDLNEAIDALAGMLRRLINEDIRIALRLDARGGRIRIDPGQLEQVLLNLAVNARDAMPRGGEIAIETRDVELEARDIALLSEAEPGPYVMLAVRDIGSGIDPTVKDRIFDPFFTTKAPGRGTGLGLATVYGIVRQNGGQIAVESEVGRGTTFRVTLPGVSAHGARRWDGHNALEAVPEVLQRLRDLETQRNTDVPEVLSSWPIAYPISVGRIHGGDWPSTVMAQVSLEGRYGVALGETNADAMTAFEKALAGTGAQVEWFGGRFASAALPSDDPLIAQLQTAHAEVAGNPPAVIGGTYGSDLRQLIRAGIACVQYGPGDAALAHSEDEEVAVADVFQCREVLQRWLQGA